MAIDKFHLHPLVTPTHTAPQIQSAVKLLVTLAVALKQGLITRASVEKVLDQVAPKAGE